MCITVMRKKKIMLHKKGCQMTALKILLINPYWFGF